MGNTFVFRAPKSSYEHSNDDSTLLYVEQKIDTSLGGTFTCTFKRKKVTKIPCRFIPSKSQSPYLIVFFHANAEDIGHQLTRFLQRFGDRFKMNVLCPEYPSYGIYKDRDESLSMEEAMISDARKVLNYCKSDLKFKYENIILIGRSLGTGIAIRLATEFSVRGTVLISPFTSIRDVAKNIAGDMLSKAVSDVFRSIDHIGQVMSPVLFIHGEEDGMIPYSLAIDLYDQTKAPKTLIINPLMTHNQFKTETNIFSPMHAFMVEKLNLEFHLTPRVEKGGQNFNIKIDLHLLKFLKKQRSITSE